MSELPDGWVQAALQDIANIRMGKTVLKKDLSETGLPVFSAGAENKPWGSVDNMAATARRGTIVISARGSIGFPKLPDFDEFISTQTTIAVEPLEDIAAEYLLQAVSHIDFQELSSGVAIPMLTVGTLGPVQILIPPLAEQKRIVRKLDTLSARTATARTHLTTIAKLVERYRSAVLALAFRGVLGEKASGKQDNVSPLASIHDLLQSDAEKHFESELAEWSEVLSLWEDGPKTEKRPAKPRKAKPPTPVSEAQKSKMWPLPKSWSWVQIGSMAFVTKLAGFEYTDFVNYDDDGDLSVLKAENAGANGFKPTQYSRVVSSTVEHLKRSQIFGGEVLVVFVGAGVGNVAAVPTGTRFFLGPNIGMVRPYGDHLNSKYLEYFLRSAPGKSLLLSEAKAVAQPSISMGAIRNTPVPMCHPDEQREIVRWIETAFAQIDRLSAEAENALKLTNRLDQRVLAKAFAGELVPQDPNDEPASVLLDRIREARANAPKKTRSRRTKATAMKKAPKDLLLADSADWPANGVTSDELATRVSMPHTDLRDALFELLGGAKPQLEQVFDKAEERMRLKRVAQ